LTYFKSPGFFPTTLIVIWWKVDSILQFKFLIQFPFKL
jgi:hypothetical protein